MFQTPERVVSVGVGTAIALLALVLCGGDTSTAQVVPCGTLYVRISGDDANDGCSAARAVRRISHAAAMAKPGSRVVVGPGIYPEGGIAPSVFGRVSFIADRRGKEVGEPAGDVVLDALGFSSGFELNHNLAVTIDGFVIYNAPIGIYVKSQSDQVVISNNSVSNNTSEGIYIQDSKNATVFNNLVYNNGRSGILVTGNVTGSPGARIINNTVYGNGDRGIFFSGTRIGSMDGLAINNVLEANVTAGIQVNAVSRSGYLSAGNVTADRFASRTPSDVTDVEADPVFVNSDPSGADHILGGPGYADDDFHLSQQAAGQAVTSPAVNAGSDKARRLKLGRATTRTDGRGDTGFVDAGYHYRNFSPLPLRPEVRLRTKPLYVSASRGADTNDGATPATAIQTLARAFELAQPGNRIRVQGGAFHEGQLSPANSGKPGRDIVFEGAAGTVIDATGFERGILISGRSNITMTGLDVTGADTGIEIRNQSSAITLRRCRFHQNTRRGLYVNDSLAVTLASSAVERNGSIGVQVEGAQMNIVGTAFTANAETGLWAFDTSTVRVSSSPFVDNVTTGVLAGRSEVTVLDGTISGSKEGGARFTDGSSGTLTRVVVLNNTDVGVQGISSALTVSGGRVEGSHVGIDGFVDPVGQGDNQLAVSGTRVCGNSGSGIHAQDTALSVTDVTLCSNGQEGLDVSGGTADVLRTVVTQNQKRGINAQDADRVTATNVMVDGNGDTGIQLATTSTASITDSELGTNNGNGLWIIGAEGTTSQVSVSGTRVCNNTNTGINVQDAALALADVIVCSNAQAGVDLRGGTAQIVRATVTGNQKRGLNAEGVSSVVIGDAVFTDNADTGVQLSAFNSAAITDSVMSSNTGNGLWVIGAPGATPAPVSVSGTRLCTNHEAGTVAQDVALTLTDVTLCENTQDGLRQTGGSAALVRARAMQNQGKGVSVGGVTGVVVQDSQVGGSGDNGVQISGAGALSISGSILFSSHGDGLTILDTAAPEVWNNLVYGNGSTGILISGDVTGSPNAQVLNNTVFQNGNRGLLIGGSSDKPASPGAQVLRNVFQSNLNAGIQVNELSLPGYAGDYNLNWDAYVPGILVALHDILSDPRFVDAAHDDFHLSQRVAGQSVSSPAVDAGGVDVVTAHMQTMSTRTDGVPDTGLVDLGYHYRQ